MSERSELVVRAVGFGPLDGGAGLLAAVAEGADGSGFSIQFSRAASWDQQDRDLGMDTYCISTSEGATYYGGVVEMTAGSGFIDVDLKPKAARTLYLPQRFRLSLAVDDDVVSRFVGGMAEILATEG